VLDEYEPGPHEPQPPAALGTSPAAQAVQAVAPSPATPPDGQLMQRRPVAENVLGEQRWHAAPPAVGALPFTHVLQALCPIPTVTQWLATVTTRAEPQANCSKPWEPAKRPLAHGVQADAAAAL
jgi:hypothetical protein